VGPHGTRIPANTENVRSLEHTGEQASLAASTPHAPERDGQTSGLRGFGRVADGKPKRFCRLTWRSSVEAAFHAELTTAPPGLFSTIEHVGSTSAPRLAAKPIIDLMAATDDLDAVAAREGDLRLLGYGFHVAGTPGRLLYRRALPTPGHTTCTSSRPVPCRPRIRCCCVTTATTTPGRRPNSSRNSPTRRGPSVASRRRGWGRSEQCGKSERC
jgi:GrpB protein